MCVKWQLLPHKPQLSRAVRYYRLSVFCITDNFTCYTSLTCVFYVFNLYLSTKATLRFKISFSIVSWPTSAALTVHLVSLSILTNACASSLFLQRYRGPAPPSAVQSLSLALGSVSGMTLQSGPWCSSSATLVMSSMAPLPYGVTVYQTTWHNGMTPCQHA